MVDFEQVNVHWALLIYVPQVTVFACWDILKLLKVENNDNKTKCQLATVVLLANLENILCSLVGEYSMLAG